MSYPTLVDFIAFLRNPASFPVPTTSVEIVQTHISVVAITDHHVYKLKKPVRFDFLDFSTLEKRQYYCEEEIRLNRRLSPDLYLGLLPLYNHRGKLSFEPGGSPVDYVIQMLRLSEEGMLIQQIKDPHFPLQTLNQIAATLLPFYQELLKKATPGPYGDADQLRHTVEEVFQGFELTPSQETPAPVTKLLREYLFGFLDKNAGLIAKRVQAGRIVEGHGDLRSEHVHIQNGQINIYDCLEFDKKLRTIDWLNDIAFLLMDLDYRTRHDLAHRLETSLLTQLEREDVSPLLNFYKTYRACVRAKVNALKLSEEEVPLPVREASQHKAYRYYQLALRYALLGSEPTVVVCLGGVASGKSTLAGTLASWLNLTHLNSDVIRKQQAGLPLHARLDDAHRTALYTPETTRKLYADMIEQAHRETGAHGAVILDATYRHAGYLQALTDYCHHHQLRLLAIHTTAPEEIIRQHLKKRESEPSISDMRLSDYDPNFFRVGYDVKGIVPVVLEADTTPPIEVLLLETVVPWLQQQAERGGGR